MSGVRHTSGNEHDQAKKKGYKKARTWRAIVYSKKLKFDYIEDRCSVGSIIDQSSMYW